MSDSIGFNDDGGHYFKRRYKDDGESWDKITGEYCYTARYIEDNFEDWRKPTIRKYNCVDYSDMNIAEEAVYHVGKTMDVVWTGIGRLWKGDDYDGGVIQSHVEGDSVGGQIAQDIRNYVYKVLHSGSSLVFGFPLFALLSAINSGLVSKGLDPGMQGLNGFTVISTDLFEPMKNHSYQNLTFDNNDEYWDPVLQSDRYLLTIEVDEFDPVFYFESAFTPGAVFDAITVS